MATALNDPYKILGVAPTASADNIQKAYRKLAKKLSRISVGPMIECVAVYTMEASGTKLTKPLP